MTAGEMVKISFRLSPDRRRGFVGETLWAERVGSDRFRLANTAFYVPGVSYRDVVFGRRGRKGVLVFAGVSLRGGHSTIWITLRVDPKADALQRRCAQLRELGCRYESAGRSLAVDIPPTSEFRAVEAVLDAGTVADLWGYEIAHDGRVGLERGRKDDAS